MSLKNRRPRVSLAPASGQRVPVRTVVGGGRDTHDGHENSPILVFFSNLLVQDRQLRALEAALFMIGYELPTPV